MIICEIGRNHQGDEDYAEEYMTALLQVRPDGISFQIREKEKYEGGAESPLSDEFYRNSAKAIHDAGIKFGIALSDPDKINFLEEIGTDFYKVLSKDITNAPLISSLLKTGKNVFVSTGTSDFAEIQGFLDGLGELPQDNLRLIHTQLSHDVNEVNLRAIPVMRDKFNLPVAYGSHSPDQNVLMLAVAFEPSDIFFYVKGERKLQHKDEEHAIKLGQVSEVVAELRVLPQAIGDGKKLKMERKT